MKHIACLIGMKHSGKSTVGAELARRLSLPFYDLDTLVETVYDPTGSKSFRGIYRSVGAAGFARLEIAAAEKLLAEASKGALVCALGGGTIENETVMRLLKPDSVFIYLKAGRDTLYKRISRTGRPAFLPEDDPFRRFGEIYNRRVPLLENCADVTADGESGSPAEIAESLHGAVLEYIHVG
jgi:shikimate kinase